MLSTIPAPAPALSLARLSDDLRVWVVEVINKAGGLAGVPFPPTVVISVPCMWACPGLITGIGHHGWKRHGKQLRKS